MTSMSLVRWGHLTVISLKLQKEAQLCGLKLSFNSHKLPWNELKFAGISISLWLGGYGAKYVKKEEQNRAYDYCNCKALGQFTSLLSRTVSCRTDALPSGIDKRRGWNKFTLLSFLLSFRSRFCCTKDPLFTGMAAVWWSWSGRRGGGAGGAASDRTGGSFVCLLPPTMLTKSMQKFGGSETKVLLICLLLTATVRMQQKQSCFSFISNESALWFAWAGPACGFACVSALVVLFWALSLILYRRFSLYFHSLTEPEWMEIVYSGLYSV